MAVMTEQKLKGIVADLFLPEGMDADYRSGFIAGFHGIKPSPCPTKNVRCAEGVVAGESVRELFLGLSGDADDASVKASIAGRLFPDSTLAISEQFISYEDEVAKERHFVGKSTLFSDIFRVAEETGPGGCF